MEDVESFYHVDNALRVFFTEHRISPKIQEKCLNCTLSLFSFVEYLSSNQKISAEDIRLLQNGPLQRVHGDTATVLNDLLKLYTIQDIVDVTATAEKESKSINQLFTMPTLGSLYALYPIGDDALKKADASLQGKLDDPANTDDIKDRARKDAYILSIRAIDPILARFTQDIISA